MKRTMLVGLALVVAAAGCGNGQTGTATTATTATTVTSGAQPTLESWCRGVSVGDCYEAAQAIAGGYLQLSCLAGAATAQEALSSCNPEPPVTTVPGTAPPTTGAIDRSEVDILVEQALVASHPQDDFTVTLVLAEPLAVAEASRQGEELGGELVAVWRTDEICVPAFGGAPGLEPSRFALVAGDEIAAQQRRDADDGKTVVTGRHIAEAAWERMTAEARALRQPGVEAAAIAVDLPLALVPGLRDDARFTLVRLAHPTSLQYSLEDGELTPAAPADCA